MREKWVCFIIFNRVIISTHFFYLVHSLLILIVDFTLSVQSNSYPTKNGCMR